ncbi:Riok1 [Symbiodinium sp. CCMP2592]|nr:Riok1 [Symbiodinium sp. CCMP2592]
MTQDTEAQMEEFFGNVTTEMSSGSNASGWPSGLAFTKCKDPDTQGANGMNRLKGQRRLLAGKGGDGPGDSKDHRNQTEGSDPEQILKMVCRALVQREDTLQVLRQDTGFVFFARTSAPSIVPTLFQVGHRWKAEAEKEIPNDEALVQQCIRSGWLDKDQKWVFQKWDSVLRSLQADTKRAALATSTVLAKLRVVLLMDLSVRQQQGTQMYGLLAELCQNSVFQLIGTQYKREILSANRWSRRWNTFPVSHPDFQLLQFPP